MNQMRFDSNSWCSRLAPALSQPAKIQEPFLEAYWQASSYPARFSFNEKDETPFPKDDLAHLYDLVRPAKRSDEKKFYKPLRDALYPVNRHSKESRFHRSIRTHCGTAGQVGRSRRRASPIFSTQINPAGRSVVA